MIRILELWRDTLHPRAKIPTPGSRPYRAAASMIAECGEEQCAQVIRGALIDRSRWPARRENDGPEILFRDSCQVAKFIEIAASRAGSRFGQDDGDPQPLGCRGPLEEEPRRPSRPEIAPGSLDWQSAAAAIAERDPIGYAQWIAGLRYLGDTHSGSAVLEAPGVFEAGWVQANWSEPLADAFSEVAGRRVGVVVVPPG